MRKALKAAFVSSGQTQATVGFLVGISPWRLARIVSGVAKPHDWEIELLRSILDDNRDPGLFKNSAAPRPRAGEKGER
jgi:hypothetical protein